MRTLLLRLAAPMQAWGDQSRFTRRETRNEPTKSGVLGLLAAAAGRRRTDSIEDLLSLAFAVRVDQEGRLLRDFQTAQRWDTGARMPLSARFYLSDALFVAGVCGEASLIDGLARQVTSPVFSLYLGRRSCPPARPVFIGVVDSDVVTALRRHPWEAAQWYRRTVPRSHQLRLVADRSAAPGSEVSETLRDVPLSFDPSRREYGWRDVSTLDPVLVENPDGRAELGRPDFFNSVVTA